MKHTLLLWAFILGVCAASALSASAQTSAAGRIVLARVTGEVSVTDKATKAASAAANNQEISQGYIVTTGKTGTVILVFSNGSTINLKEDSVLDIETYLQDPFAEPFDAGKATAEPSASTTKINLTRGELIGNVKKLNKDKGSSFSVQTPVGAAGIRGTTFRIVYRPRGDGTALFTLTIVEGNIEFLAGAVNLPVGVGAAGEAREIVIETTVDRVTGAVTIIAPQGGFVLVLAPSASKEAVQQAIQQVAQAVATMIFTPVVVTPFVPPPMTVPPQETTPGAGKQ